MALIAIPFIAPALAAIGEAVLYTVGVIGTAIIVSEAIDAIDEALENEEGSAAETCKTVCSTRACPPCVPPAGTIRVERIDRVPPSRPHAPCPGDHAHLVQRNQAPYPNCRCFWNKALPDNVECLPQGGSPSYPMR